MSTPRRATSRLLRPAIQQPRARSPAAKFRQSLGSPPCTAPSRTRKQATYAAASTHGQGYDGHPAYPTGAQTGYTRQHEEHQERAVSASESSSLARESESVSPQPAEELHFCAVYGKGPFSPRDDIVSLAPARLHTKPLCPMVLSITLRIFVFFAPACCRWHRELTAF